MVTGVWPNFMNLTDLMPDSEDVWELLGTWHPVNLTCLGHYRTTMMFLRCVPEPECSLCSHNIRHLARDWHRSIV